ncbi:hypothetical protein BH09PLA1_BH09PLA1_36060 [soil metagenome]
MAVGLGYGAIQLVAASWDTGQVKLRYLPVFVPSAFSIIQSRFRSRPGCCALALRAAARNRAARSVCGMEALVEESSACAAYRSGRAWRAGESSGARGERMLGRAKEPRSGGLHKPWPGRGMGKSCCRMRGEMMIESSGTEPNERLGHGGTKDTEKYQFSVSVFSVLSVSPLPNPHFVGVPMHRTTARRVLADGARRLANCCASAGGWLAEARHISGGADRWQSFGGEMGDFRKCPVGRKRIRGRNSRAGPDAGRLKRGEKRAIAAPGLEPGTQGL